MADPILGVLFDKDGTLVDYSATWAPINVAAACFAADGDPDLAEHLLRIGGHDPVTGRIAAGSLLAASHTIEIAQAWRNAGSPFTAAALTCELDRIFTEGAAAAVAVPNVVQLFQELHGAGMRSGVATSDSVAGAHATLRTIGLDGLLDFVAGYDSGHGGKPEPGMATAFSKATGLPPYALAMVGDNLHDIRMGRAAAFSLCVGVLTGTSTRQDLEAEADHILDDVTHLPHLLQHLGRWPSRQFDAGANPRG
ncbi:HAD family hydrolase [Jiella sp. MQZ9-1]|uniref:HAD family hydrolase n=1 Tax=Jiella flava TaxID=2816857 RepID=A0A939G038_9HYPH|nr:HAD family hydrolase [Jiella flava]MBO0663148.1 HAD family hydrolase [Jiella flava]MCD2471567.1 HAD family hydrolase [Jiella flava]